MNPLRHLLALTTLAAVAACADSPGEPTSALPGRPHLDTRVATAEIGTAPYTASNGDWTAALQLAVNSARTVHVPTGTYPVSGSVTLPAGTRVYGDGAGSKLVQDAAASVFVATGSSAAFVDSLTVDHLGFQGPRSTYALDVRTARHVWFTDNSATTLGLLHVSTHLPINVWDGTADPAATAGLTSESQLSSDIKVQRNHGTGDYVLGAGNGTSGAIFIQYAADVVVSGDTLSNYAHGIEWWGGDADPSRGGVPANPRWLRRLSATGNSVTNVEGGIWGGMGSSVTVSGNFVQNCADVCLDDEGGVDVSFISNQARNAGTAVLSVFNYSRRVTFSGNDVQSDGVLGTSLFWSSNVQQLTDSVTITLQNNSLTYTGATGVGRIGKAPASLMKVQGNTISNAIVALDPGNNGGGDQVLGNHVSLDRSTGGAPAISIGHNYGAWGASGYLAQVNGNRITSSVAQDTARGIYIHEIGIPTGGCVTVDSDTIQGFGRWLKLAADDATNPCFTVSNNRYAGVTTAAIEAVGSPNLTQTNNAAFSPAGVLTVSISGNTSPRATTSQTYFAAAGNGTAPYAYQWYKNGAAQIGKTASSYTLTVSSTSFNLQVRVTDATGTAVYSNVLYVTPVCSTCAQ